MPHDENLRALRNATARDPSHEQPLLLLEALVALPLSDDDWRGFGNFANAVLVAMLDDPARATGSSLERWLDVLVRVPLESVRLQLAELAQGADTERASSAARALATQRDESGLEALLSDFARAPSERTALALAQLPAESLQDVAEVLAPGIEAEPPMVRVWVTLALAKSRAHEDPRAALEALERLWNEVVHASRGDEPPLFWGDPWRTVAELSKVRPLPAPLRAALLSLKDRDFDRDWRPRSARPEASPRHAKLLVAGLTGAYDVHGAPLAAPARADDAALPDPAEALRVAAQLTLAPWSFSGKRALGVRINLGHDERLSLLALPETDAARLVHAVLEALTRSAGASPGGHAAHRPEGAADALLDLVSALPPALPLDLDRLLDESASLEQQVTRKALAWTLARAGLERVLGTLARRIVVSSGEQRQDELAWLRDIARELNAPAPYQGAGGEEPGTEPRSLVDDRSPQRVRAAPDAEPDEASHVSEDALEISELSDFMGPLPSAPPRLLGYAARAPGPVAAEPPTGLRAGERGSPSADLADDGEPVDVAVFCPGQVARGDTFLVQVFLYPPPSEAGVVDEARQADDSAERRGRLSLPVDLPVGTRLDLHLEMPALIVSEPDAVVVWRGRSTSAQFDVSVPAATAAAQAIGRVRIAVAGTPTGTLRFVVKVAAAGAAPQPAEPREIRARRYRNAFVSYSSADRAEVLRRVQAFRIAGLSVFQDILDLEPGERWERALYRHIDECDVFLLFWSRAAAASPWVGKEIEYALARKANDDENPPDIQPVPLEGPPPVPPPPGLSAIHFNDALLAHIRAADQTPTAPRA